MGSALRFGPGHPDSTPNLWAISCFLPRIRVAALRSTLKVLFTPLDVRSASDRMQFASDLASDLRSKAPLHSKQIRRTRIPFYFKANQWCRTCISRNDNYSLLITSKENQLTIQSFHYRLPNCPVQLLAVSRVNIVANQTNFPFR